MRQQNGGELLTAATMLVCGLAWLSLFPLLTFCATNGMQQIAALTPQQFPDVQRKASHGDPVAEAILAIAYEQGIHVVRDDAESAKWFRRLAERGSVDAQNRMGILCQEGRGVPQSYSAAAE